MAKERMEIENQFIIREAKQTDMEALKEICNLSFPRFYRFFSIRSLKTSGVALLGEVNRRVAGFAKLIQFHVGNETYGGVLWLAVHPAFRRRGIAHALVEMGTEYLLNQGAKTVYASTQNHNTATLNLFNKVGYRRVRFYDRLKRFGWRVFEFKHEMWIVPTEIVLACDQKPTD